MSARAAELVAGTRERWALAGDQLYVDLDISESNLPPGTRLAAGTAVVEITPPPHTGCKKFVERFGREAMLFVNSPEGRALRLRGVNARVVEPGVVRPGDEIRKLA
jgi:MOSC domain-containing protein YiiM